MKVNELRNMSIDELRNEQNSLLKEQFNLRMQGGQGQEVRPHLFHRGRRMIARIKTIITEKTKEGSLS